MGTSSQKSNTTRAHWALALLLVSIGVAPSSTESAVANGDTRTLSLTDQNTGESGTFTYMVNGSYDKETLAKLNWFLRDWRLDESTQMDPKLFDILWEVYRESGSREPVDVLSGYRSPQTNAMLRHRSRQVARHSQHMEGKAIDAHFVDVPTATIRDIAMRMQAGGVGFYPTGARPWVHIDSSEVRYWPRMSRDALARLFPDGKTVFIPRDGKPMPGYEVAKAEIESRGGDVAPTTDGGENPIASLFARPSGDDSDEGEGVVVTASARGRAASAFLSSPTIAQAKADLPKGETFAQAAPDAQSEAAADEPALRGSDAAPLPPRRPAEFQALALAAAPPPPRRPAEFAVASVTSKPIVAPGGERDLILALLAKGRAPSVITRGLSDKPREALALTETVEAPESPQDMYAAAALAAPLPPPRPPLRLEIAVEPAASAAGTSEEPRRVAASLRPSLDPYGAIAVQAFDPVSSPLADALRSRALASSD